MTLHYEDGGLRLFHGSNKDILPTFPDASFDSIVTDPPYELGFMGKGWDSSGIAYDVDLWRECFRVLKPGGYMLAFGGTRTWHRIAVAIEDAGFEIRDSIAWMYGSGFPKSMNVSKAIEATLTTGGSHSTQKRRAAMGDDYAPSAADGTFRKVESAMDNVRTTPPAFEPTTDEAREWAGWGTALKPAFEPIIVARKPLAGTVAANVLASGTGAINIDACRVHTAGTEPKAYKVKRLKPGATLNREGGNWRPDDPDAEVYEGMTKAGRFPSNVLLSHSPLIDPGTGEVIGDACADGCVPGCAVAELDRQAPETGGAGKASGPSLREPTDAGVAFGARRGLVGEPAFYGDRGGASRFFPTFRYEAKAPGSERPTVDGVAHATVKPLDLMQWLVRLVTRRGGHVLDLFAGSGTTGEAALLEGMKCTLIELEIDHLPLILARVRKPLQPSIFGDWQDGTA